MDRSTAENIAHFLPIYYKLLQQYGRYLNDIEYENLRSPAQHKILTEAHNLWIENLEKKESYGSDEKLLKAHKFIREQVLENEQLKEINEELRRIITGLTI